MIWRTTVKQLKYKSPDDDMENNCQTAVALLAELRLHIRRDNKFETMGGGND